MEVRADVVDTSASVPVNYEEPACTPPAEVVTPEPVDVGTTTDGDAGPLTMQGGYAAYALNQTFDATLAAQTAPPDVDAAVAAVSAATDNVGGNPAEVLANELAKGDEQYRTQLIGALATRDPEALATALNGAGGDYNDQWPAISADRKQLIADSVGSAYNAGTVPSNFLDNLTSISNAGVDGVNRIADLLAGNTTSSQLKVDFANKALSLAFDPRYASRGDNRGYAAAALRVVNRDPAAMAQVLNPYNTDAGVNGKTLKDVVGLAAASNPVRLDAYNYLGDPIDGLLNGAAALPASEQGLAYGVFKTAVDDLDGYVSGARGDALIRLYNSHARFITDQLTDETAIERNQNLITLSEFFQKTLFNSDTTLKADLTAGVKGLADQYRAENRPYQLGNLAGTIENGFELAVAEQQKRADAVKSFVSLLFEIVPVGGKIAKVLGDALGPEVGQRVADILSKKTGDAAQKEISKYLENILTEDTGFLLFGRGQKIKDRNQVDSILRGMFDVPNLTDTDPNTPGNQGIRDYETGVVYAHDALDGR